MPEHGSESYIWQRTLTTYNSGQTSTSAPTCISGMDGDALSSADTAQSMAEAASSVASAAYTGVSDLSEWVYRYADGLRIGKSDSRYNTYSNDTGFHVQQDGVTIGSFAKRMLSSEAVKIGKVNSTRDHLVLRVAYDGGIEIVGEED